MDTIIIPCCCCCSVAQSDSLWPRGLQHTKLPVLHYLSEFTQTQVHWGFLSWQRICLPIQEAQEMWIWSLGWEDSLEKEMATHSNILAWKIPWTEEPGWLQSIESVMPSDHLILCHPLLFLPSFFPSIRVFSSESALCIKWPKYWSFSFSISPSSEYWRLISFKIDWIALLALQGTLKSLLQHHSSKASVLRCSVFFMVQLSHLYMKNERKKEAASRIGDA